jgi:RNase P/RNase MRP subunit p30
MATKKPTTARCGYTLTTCEFGPRGGVKSKVWRCSRKGKHVGLKSDPYYNGKPCMLCTQHLKIVKAARKKEAKLEKDYQEFLKRDAARRLMS